MIAAGQPKVFVMIRRIPLIFLGALLSLGATASDDTDRQPIKVDLQEVVERQEVMPVDGITVSGQPDEEALAVFAASGYSTVIDLRAPGEDRGLDEAGVAESLGLDYVQLPVRSGKDVSFDRARQLQSLIDEADGPVLLHCGSGNRVGALLALAKSLDGSSDEEALEYGRSAGLTRLEGKVKETLEQKEP